METIASLQRDLTKQKEETENAYAYKLDCEARLQGLQHGVEKIFKLIRCEDAPVLNLLGSHKRVSIHNVDLFLGIIERRTNQIITSINFTVEQPSRILAKKDRIPKFNVRDSAKRKQNY